MRKFCSWKIRHAIVNKFHGVNFCPFVVLTLILLTWRIWWAPNSVSKWQMGFNSAFKGLMSSISDEYCWDCCGIYLKYRIYLCCVHPVLRKLNYGSLLPVLDRCVFTYCIHSSFSATSANPDQFSKLTDIRKALEEGINILRTNLMSLALLFHHLLLNMFRISFLWFFIRVISKLYICIPTNCTQLIYFINNTLKHMYCLKL